MYLFELEFLSFLGMCRGIGMPDNMVMQFLVFEGTSILFSIMVLPIYILTNSEGGCPSLIHSPAFIICRFFEDGHSDWCEVIPHFSFDLHFSNN